MTCYLGWAMKTKTDSSAALALFLARGGSVTRVAPSERQALSLKTLRERDEERATATLAGKRTGAIIGTAAIERDERNARAEQAENDAEMDGEIFGAAMAAGVGSYAAMEEVNYVRSRRGR